MPALIDLRRRIRSVRNTQQITLAMKNVATAKFKRAQRVVLESRPYWHSFPILSKDVAIQAQRIGHPLLEERDERKITGLVITSDKGLCGAFNSNLLEAAKSFFDEKARSCKVGLILIGKKAAMAFRKQSFPIEKAYAEQVHTLTHLDLKKLAREFIVTFANGETDAVYVLYNEFKSILAPRVTVTRLLPIGAREGIEQETGRSWEDSIQFSQSDWEPASLTILDVLLPHYVEIQVRHAFFESQAAEQAARMMSMDNATKNAGELIEKLTLILNKIRQASITKELLEIMSAVEALSKK